MSTHFQTVVKSGVPARHRRDAINRMIDQRERTNLAILVQMGGLSGEFRRRALAGLGDCNASDELEELAEDTTVEPSLRRRADELA
ncbi:hypothetical protein [Natronolimnobius baerhuensis]|uniref:Uncharacterized protein n=1 Tax=Natronolimnobius baerhuensis TaxID=253108 RepID=A0A202E6D6_9EURY|nr:hypothetical protein [Natronolimnobius baerhuensis]OVE83754.1 hypothetical protein B2G88_15145 [Natronolimnobius baerhuensis]